MDTLKLDYRDNLVIPSLVIFLTLAYVLLGFIERGSSYEIDIALIAVNFFYILISVLLLRAIIGMLDNIYPWSRAVLHRFLIQVVITAGIYLIIQTLIINYFGNDELSGPEKLSTKIGAYAIGMATLLFINGLYLVLYTKQSSTSKAKQLLENSNKFVIAKKGKIRLNVSTENLRTIYIANGLVMAKDSEENRLVLQDSLSDLEKILDDMQFFRVNRQTILHKESISEVISNDNRSLSIHLNQNNDSILVSRHKAPAFKKWLKA